LLFCGEDFGGNMRICYKTATAAVIELNKCFEVISLTGVAYFSLNAIRRFLALFVYCRNVKLSDEEKRALGKSLS